MPSVTNKVIEHVQEWQKCPLEPVYFAVWMDGIVLKVKQNGKYINKRIYLVIELKKDGFKEILGMWMAETDSASFWMSTLADLKARGVEDILIACTDNLKGFTDAIKDVYAASNRDAAEHALAGFAAKWEQKYKHAILSWKTNWDNLTSYFDFPIEICSIIYTTNTIENVNRGFESISRPRFSSPTTKLPRRLSTLP